MSKGRTKRVRGRTQHLATRIHGQTTSTGAMATHGSVSAYDRSKEDWTSYIERLNFYFAANDVTAETKKRAILLSVCGASTYKLIRSLVSEPDKLNSTPYKDIVKLVKNHYDPKPSSIVQRHKFNTRTRAPGESIAAYVAALREIAEHCNYKESLNDMLRDRLVCGVNHEKIQQKLMSEKDLTYATALEIADDGSRRETYPAPCYQQPWSRHTRNSQCSFDVQTEIQGERCEAYEYKYEESGHTSVLS